MRDRIRWKLWPRPGIVVRYTVAVALVLVIAIVKQLVPDIGAEQPEALLTIAVAAAAFYGGLGPGIVAVLGATAIGAYFDPITRLRPAGPDPIAEIAFLVARLFVATVAASARSAFARTAEALEHSRRLERERETFVHVLSHELRNPLTSLSGTLELAERYEGSPEKHERVAANIGTARRQVDRLSRLIKDIELLLTLSGPQLPIATERFDLRASATNVVARYEALRGSHPIRLVLPEEPAIVDADPDRIDQILDNLVKNAIHYSPQESEIVVEVELQRGRPGLAIISVRDHGAGVSPVERERIFERFARGSASRGTEGSGVGLAVARELAERMGGTVVLADTSPEGSTFQLRLPLSVRRGEPGAIWTDLARGLDSKVGPN